MAKMVIETRDAYAHVVDAPHTAVFEFPAIIDILRQHGCRRILDIGCGNGALCRTLVDAGFSVVGVEPSPSGVTVARTAVPSATFYELGVYDDPQQISDVDFDCVVSTDVVEHLFYPSALPKFAAAKLKADGLFVISTPYHGYFKNLAISLCNMWDAHHTSLWDGGHIKFWSRQTLTRLLQLNGFSVLTFKGLGRCPLFWCSMVLVARKKQVSESSP